MNLSHIPGHILRRHTKRLVSPWLFQFGRVGRCLPPSNGCVIVTFHRVADADTLGPFGHTVWGGSCATFAATVAWLQERFHFITLDQLSAAVTDRHRLPPRALLLTFDDGYRDVFLCAFPILNRLNAPAAVFITTDVIDQTEQLLWMDKLSYAVWTTSRDAVEFQDLGEMPLAAEPLRRAAYGRISSRLKCMEASRRDRELDRLFATLNVTLPRRMAEALYLSSDEIRTMSQNGVVIGSHACSHSMLSRLSRSEARREIVESKTRLEAIVESPVTAFAYPNGTAADFTDETVALLREAGFSLAMTTTPGVNRLDGAHDPFRLKRVHAGQNLSELQYFLGLTGVTERFSVRRSVSNGSNRPVTMDARP